MVFAAAAFEVRGQDWQIVPGQRVGAITANTSEKELIRIYGATNVKRINVDVGEGETRPGTVLFPNDPQKKISILWRDAATREQPESVTVRGKSSLWKTDRGITIGTPLKMIEELNGRPFALAGFGWDYGGTVLHANGGQVAELGTEKGEDITGRTLLLRLEPAASLQKSADYRSVLGDGKFMSDHPAMKKLNPTVYEMIIEFADAAQGEAQNPLLVEKELVARIKTIQTYSIYGGNYDEAKLTNAQNDFQQKLVKYTKLPWTLNYSFSELAGHVTIATSDDGKLRSYSWDMQDGGTMHRFARLFQYEGADGKIYSVPEKAPDEGMGNGFVTDIFKLETGEGPVYIVCSTFFGSTKDHFQSANLYRVERSMLNDKVRLFKTTSGLTNTLGFEYDNFSVIDRPNAADKLITFDKKTGTLTIPVVIKDAEYPDGRVTDRKIRYRFDGKYFVKL